MAVIAAGTASAARGWFVLLVCLAHPAPALDLRYLFGPGEKLSLTERADLRRFENGAFVGLAFREVRGVLEASGEAEATRLEGQFYVFEETRHDTRLVAKKVDDVVPVSLTVRPDGQSDTVAGETEAGYPSMRSFPVLPAGEVEPGTSWQAYGVRVVEPFRDGRFTRVRIYCDYRYLGTERREGREVAFIRAQYAVRYKGGDDPGGDERVRGITGRHVVSITFDTEASRPTFMQDQMEETYTLAEGKSVAFKGFILTWFDAVEPLNRARVAADVTEKLKEGGVEGVEVAQGERGVTLTVNSIHFVAEEATVLPEEVPRLAVLADALKRIPGRTFLVVGHTARYGSVESQERLSVERARAIVDNLVSQGIDARRFIYEGRGARESVAPNDTEENMARNRRVEIVILED